MSGSADIFDPRDLDLVHDNPRLTFPEDVELNFVFWRHTPEGMPYLKRHLLGADAIAMEVFSLSASVEGHEEVISMANMGRRVEKQINRYVSEKPIKGDLKALRSYGGYCWEMAQLASSLPAKPRVYFVDDYANNSGDSEMQRLKSKTDGPLFDVDEQRLSDLLEFIGDCSFEREALVLEKLSRIAFGLSKRGPGRQVAVIYGAAHNLMAVAAKQMGAQVTETYVHGIPSDIIMSKYISDMIRFGALPHFDEMSDDLKKRAISAIVVDIAFRLFSSSDAGIAGAAEVWRLIEGADLDEVGSLVDRAMQVNTFDKLFYENGGDEPSTLKLRYHRLARRKRRIALSKELARLL